MDGSRVRLLERRPALARAAGPALIAGSVVLVLRAYAFQGRLSDTHPDVLPFWYPTFCYLGKSLAHGHIPAWNPHVMGGVPFAADPQSGWMYLPAMLLFSVLPCGLAMSWFIVLQPLLAGLGIYGFLRSEGVSRTGATVGGVALSLVVAESGLAQSLPFAGVIAWTSVMLFAASRLLRSRSWSARIGWVVATALAWGQASAALITAGVFVASLALVVFVVARLAAGLALGRRGVGEAIGLAALLLVALPFVNLAYFLPRLAYFPRTSLSLGYQTLDRLNAAFAGVPRPVKGTGGGPVTGVFSFTEPGGAYLGAITLALAFAGWRVRRRRPLAAAFALFGLASYLIGSSVVARWIGPGSPGSLLEKVYAHSPGRLALGLIIAVPVLAAVGVDAWRERAGPLLRAAMLAPAIAVWLVLPLALGLHWQHAIRPAIGAAVALAALAAVAVRPAVVALIPVVLAGELSINALTSPTQPCCPVRPTPAVEGTIGPGYPPARPEVSASAFGRAGPIASFIRRDDLGRYVSIAPRLSRSNLKRARRNWPFMAPDRSMLFGIDEAQGYDPAQLKRYWTFLRATQRAVILYNEAYFLVAKPVAVNLLQIAYIVQPSSDPPAVSGSDAVVTEDGFTLYRLPSPSPRASFVGSWSNVGGSRSALAAILAPGFDPNATVILEREPGLPSGSPGTGAPSETAQYTAEGDQAARVTVDAPAAGLLLVRNSFDGNWHATVDGRPAPVLAADYVIQAVAVPAGRHEVRLTYDDPAVGYGLIGSALAILNALALAAVLQRRRSIDHAA